MTSKRKQNSFSFRESRVRRSSLILVGSLILLTMLIVIVVLTNNYLFSQTEISVSRIEYFVIFGGIAWMFGGVFVVTTWYFMERILQSGKSNRIAHTISKFGDDDLAFQQKSIAALLSISESSGDFLPLEQVFRHALRVVQEVTGFNTVVIRLYDENTQTFRIAAQQGMTPSMREELAVAEIDNPIVSKALETFWPVPIEDLTSADAALVGSTPILGGFRSLVCIPLVSGEFPIGTIDLGSKEPHRWNQDELRWLALVGRMVGSIVHQVRLTEHLRDFAALQERSRLAQELHDGLVQLVGSINLWSKEAQESFAEEDYPSTQEALERIQTFSSDAYASLREELLGLRDTFDADRDLLSVIREFLSRFQRQWGIRTELILDESQNVKISQIISPAAEIQLLRIIQEALTNVRRHAEATQVTVEIAVDEEKLQIFVDDDGQGFELSEVKGDHLGLNIMRERVTSVAGTFKLDSELGIGTKIQLEIPRQQISVIHRSVK